MATPLRRLPLVEQAAAHLREGILKGRWLVQLPGVVPLADELMVSKDIVREAFKLLENEGLLEDCGAGRKRKIVENRANKLAQRSLRIGIMLEDPLGKDTGQTASVLLAIRHMIETLGHVCVFGERSLSQLNDKLPRISKIVKAAEADAWIVCVASRVVLEWFIAQSFPVYAYGGRFQNLPVASGSTRIASAIESALTSLVVDLGHRRIVLLAPTVLRKPVPTPSLERYLTLLEEHGIAATNYHLPHFEDTAEGLETCLDALFRVTPPTAMLVHQADHYSAVLSFLARRGLQVPRDVSMICMTLDPVFRVCLPTPAHFDISMDVHITNITRWIDSVTIGRPTKRQTLFDAVYVPGGTVGPAKH